MSIMCLFHGLISPLPDSSVLSWWGCEGPYLLQLSQLSSSDYTDQPHYLDFPLCAVLLLLVNVGYTAVQAKSCKTSTSMLH